MPKNMTRTRVVLDQNGKMIKNAHGQVLLEDEPLYWSHELVGQAAELLGWPYFPGNDESLDRAHFYQAYRAEMNRLLEEEGKLPAVKKYLEEKRGKLLPEGQETRKKP